LHARKCVPFSVLTFETNHAVFHVVVFVENCTANHQGCDTIWNTNVNSLYRDLITGTLTSDHLETFCRCGSHGKNHFVYMGWPKKV